MKNAFREIIAHRTFDRPKGDQLVLHIFKPEADARGDWRCEFRLTKGRKATAYQAYGVDSLQSLMLALEMVRIRLETDRNRRSLSWLGTDDLGLASPIAVVPS